MGIGRTERARPPSRSVVPVPCEREAADPTVGWTHWSVGVRHQLVTSLLHIEWPAGRALEADNSYHWEPEKGPCPSWGSRPPPPHQPPGVDCSCGISAVRALPGGHGRGPELIGCAALWGSVVEQERSWRARYAYPVVMFASPSLDEAGRRRIAYAYSVPVYSLPAVPWALRRFGGELLRLRAEELRSAGGQPGPALDAFIAEVDRVAPGARAEADAWVRDGPRRRAQAREDRHARARAVSEARRSDG